MSLRAQINVNYHQREAGMQDYSITKSTRRCALSGRALEPNENYFSVIVPNGDDVVRVDIAASHWTGPGDGAIGWWRSKMPAAAAKKMRPAPNGVLLDTLSDLLQRPGKDALAYLLALLLVRRRVLQEEQNFLGDEPPQAPAGVGQDIRPMPSETWKLVCPADGRHWHVVVVEPATEEAEKLQAELKGLLFTDE